MRKSLLEMEREQYNIAFKRSNCKPFWMNNPGIKVNSKTVSNDRAVFDGPQQKQSPKKISAAGRDFFAGDES